MPVARARGRDCLMQLRSDSLSAALFFKSTGYDDDALSFSRLNDRGDRFGNLRRGDTQHKQIDALRQCSDLRVTAPTFERLDAGFDEVQTRPIKTFAQQIVDDHMTGIEL